MTVITNIRDTPHAPLFTHEHTHPHTQTHAHTHTLTSSCLLFIMATHPPSFPPSPLVCPPTDFPSLSTSPSFCVFFLTLSPFLSSSPSCPHLIFHLSPRLPISYSLFFPHHRPTFSSLSHPPPPPVCNLPQSCIRPARPLLSSSSFILSSSLHPFSRPPLLPLLFHPLHTCRPDYADECLWRGPKKQIRAREPLDCDMAIPQRPVGGRH